MEEYSFFTCTVIFNSLLLPLWIRGSDKLNNDPNISHFIDVAEILVELMPSKGIFNRLTVRNTPVQSMFYETSHSTLRRKQMQPVSQSKPTASNETESVIIIFKTPKNKCPEPDGFIDEFYQTFREELMYFYCYCSVAKSCLTLCQSMSCSMPVLLSLSPRVCSDSCLLSW